MANVASRAEQNVEMADRMYDCRRAARGILGKNYAERLEPWRELIARVMTVKGKTTLSAAIAIGQSIDASDGIALMLLFAAAVEMVEEAGSPPRGSHVGEG